jgi:glycosyltransferase involved in cell wall biosynthesis
MTSAPGAHPVESADAGRVFLVVNHIAPEFDRAAGYARMLAMLEALQRSTRVALLVTKPELTRPEYVEAVRSRGVEVRCMDTMSLAYAVRDAWGVLFVFYQNAERYLASVRRLRPDVPIVVDSVDLHFVREWRMAKFERRRGCAYARAAWNAMRELAVYSMADGVVTATEDDRRSLRWVLPNRVVTVVPVMFPPRPSPPEIVQRLPASLLFIGGFRHQPNVDAVLFLCREIMPLVRAWLPEVSLTIVGDAPPEDVLALRGDRVSVTGYVPDIAPYLGSHDLSVAPLRYGSGMKGKVVQAMAAGLPVVTTSIGAEGLELVHGETALIADSARNFADCIVRLCGDPELRARLGARALEHVASRAGPLAVERPLRDLQAWLAGAEPRRLARWQRAWASGLELAFRYPGSRLDHVVTRLDSRARWYWKRCRRGLA